jgi:hypothetical protein
MVYPYIAKLLFFLDNNRWNSLEKSITNDFKNKGKYNMVPEFCRKNLTPYFQSAIKPIVLVDTN